MALLLENNILFVARDGDGQQMISKRLQQLMDTFFGLVVRNGRDLTPATRSRLLYVVGDVQLALASLTESVMANTTTLVVKQLSRNCDVLTTPECAVPMTLIDVGQVPLRMPGIGVMFPRFFGDTDGNGVDYFKQLSIDHQFQSLTESNKPSVAYRSGIYLSDVIQQADDSLAFHLLRCSSNLRGPTDNFGATDRRIVAALNDVAQHCYERPAPFNHVLAQIYHNSRDADSLRETKAKIAPHSDKTKDMPATALIAFATFYDSSHLADGTLDDVGSDDDDEFDWRSNGESVLTHLQFVLKEPARHASLPARVRVTLYPRSVLLISLDTNRLYTHEIRPPAVAVERMPTRLGYVVRCSKTRAVHRDGQTFIVGDDDGQLRPLRAIDADAARAIKALYWAENATEERVAYATFTTSFNGGDYLAPSNARRP